MYKNNFVNRWLAAFVFVVVISSCWQSQIHHLHRLICRDLAHIASCHHSLRFSTTSFGSRCSRISGYISGTTCWFSFDRIVSFLRPTSPSVSSICISSAINHVVDVMTSRSPGSYCDFGRFINFHYITLPFISQPNKSFWLTVYHTLKRW